MYIYADVRRQIKGKLGVRGVYKRASRKITFIYFVGKYHKVHFQIHFVYVFLQLEN